jgi:hypothetical protein
MSRFKLHESAFHVTAVTEARGRGRLGRIWTSLAVEAADLFCARCATVEDWKGYLVVPATHHVGEATPHCAFCWAAIAATEVR